MKLCGFEVGLDQPFFLIAGPCVVESEQLQLDVAGQLKEITSALGIHERGVLLAKVDRGAQLLLAHGGFLGVLQRVFARLVGLDQLVTDSDHRPIVHERQRAMAETTRRRDIQRAYNEKYGITPESINSAVRALIEISADTEQRYGDSVSAEDKEELIRALEDKMLSAAGDLDFEKAAKYRDELFQLQGKAPLEKEQPQPLHRRRSTRHPKVK